MNIELATAQGTIVRRSDSVMKEMEVQTMVSTNTNRYGVPVFTIWAAICTIGIGMALFFENGIVWFVFHPVLMVAAWLFFATEGILSYHALDLANPRSPTKKTQRLWHQKMQMACALTTFIGFGVILINKWRLSRSIIPHSLHAWLGILTILLCTLQVVIGRTKVRLKRFATWHGNSGLLTYIIALLSIISGLTQVFSTTVPLVVYCIITLSVSTCVLLAIVCKRRKQNDSSSDRMV